jgi:transcriptional antiterminator NusG
VNWYVIQVTTGSEVAIRDKILSLSIGAAVPIENRPIRKGGEWLRKEYVLFPGYVFLHMDFTADHYYQIIKIPGAIRFLGEASHPSTLSHLEAEWIGLLAGGGKALEPTKVKVTSDGNIEIVSGILAKVARGITKFDRHAHKATFESSICGEIKSVQLGIEILEPSES